MKVKRFIITRVIKQKFEVEALNKNEALKICNEDGDPYSIEVVKESVKIIKQDSDLWEE
jgi:hypothetical protein